MNSDPEITPKIIIDIVESYYRGKKATEICQEFSIERQALDNWLFDYGHIANDILKLKNENDRLKEMYKSLEATNLSLYHEIEDLQKKLVFRSK
ncbi:MAG: hypothetical protein EOP00_23010 [Pedobacter sp.]|nr:MAG: hypothetical protein EOP00_23010 [Pedobacter sp.]